MKSNPNKYIGNRFSRLVIVAVTGFYVGPDGWKRPRVLCKCDCSKEKEILLKDILSGKIRSCSCLQKESTYRTHRMTDTTEYRIWANMLTRCYNKNVTSYKYYGARGISVCSSWRNSFESFFDDMGSRPSFDVTLDRINNNGNYEPSNCRWATKRQQTDNKRPGSKERFIEYNGEKKNIKKWSEYFGINYQTFYTRVAKMGMSMEEAANFKQLNTK